MSVSLQPLDIGPSEDGSALRIRWDDGTESVLAPRDLRMNCPCAGCVDEMSGHRILKPEDVSPDIHMTAIHYVGRYALQFVWSDGHDTGLYPFTLLRELGERFPGAELV